MEKFKKMLEKKRAMGKSLSEPDQAAKMHAVQTLKDFANDAMKDDMGGKLHKVTVASDSDHGLVEGLEKAHDVVSGGARFGDLSKFEGEKKKDMTHMASEDDELPEHEDPNPVKEEYHKMAEDTMAGRNEEPGTEEDEEEMGPDAEESSEEEHSEMSEDDLNKELERLMAMKKKMGSKKTAY